MVKGGKERLMGLDLKIIGSNTKILPSDSSYDNYSLNNEYIWYDFIKLSSNIPNSIGDANTLCKLCETFVKDSGDDDFHFDTYIFNYDLFINEVNFDSELLLKIKDLIGGKPKTKYLFFQIF